MRLVVACVTKQRLLALPDASTERRSYLLRFATPVSLRGRDGTPSGFRFDIRQSFSTAFVPMNRGGNWQIELRRYQYRVLDRDERELLVYHWHPGATGSDAPHLHISASLMAQVDARTRREIALDKFHVVTGQVSLQAVVRMLITEFGIRPLRADWEERLSTPAVH